MAAAVPMATAAVLLVITSAIVLAVQFAVAARERDKSEQVATLLLDVFQVADPSETRGAQVTAREVLDRGVTRVEALPFGIAAWRLGAGRARAEDPVLHAAGIDLHAKPGDRVEAGQPLFTVLGEDDSRFERALEALDGAWEIGTDAPASSPLVLERITA